MHSFLPWVLHWFCMFPKLLKVPMKQNLCPHSLKVEYLKCTIPKLERTAIKIADPTRMQISAIFLSKIAFESRCQNIMWHSCVTSVCVKETKSIWADFNFHFISGLPHCQSKTSWTLSLLFTLSESTSLSASDSPSYGIIWPWISSTSSSPWSSSELLDNSAKLLYSESLDIFFSSPKYLLGKTPCYWQSCWAKKLEHTN